MKSTGSAAPAGAGGVLSRRPATKAFDCGGSIATVNVVRVGAKQPGRPMKTYTIYVHDRRLRQQVMLAAELADDRRAHEFAEERLASSDDYSAVEVWEGDVRLYRLQAADAGGKTRAA